MTTISNTQREALGSAFNLTIQAMRLYTIQVIRGLTGTDQWADAFKDCLHPGQAELWESDIKNGIAPEDLIDFGHLKSFAITFKEQIRNDFHKKTNRVPTWMEEIAEVRNKWAHHGAIETSDLDRAFSNMLLLAENLGMDELEQELKMLKDPSKVSEEESATTPPVSTSIVPWYKNVTPHIDIKLGLLDEVVFAANLAQVALGNAREIYLNPEVFFSKTYFTAGLRSIAKRVVTGLNQQTETENRVISLQTGFGGGKTHSLISLYHLAKWGKQANESKYLKDLIEHTGPLQFSSANIAVFTNATNDPTQGRKVDGLHLKTLWGELAYQLGGKKGYAIIKENDENRTAPKGLFARVLEETKPALILIDELADYCVSASAITVGASNLSDQTISFIQELSEAVGQVPNVVLVATLPASADEVANSQNGAEILTSLSNRFSRIGADSKPVANEEIFEVIRRRLFEDLGDEKTRDAVIATYMQFYDSLVLSSEIPSKAAKSDFRNLLKKSYPFHPELIDMFRIRWASNHDFQRTRGVLRLLASIVSDLWKRQASLSGSNGLIHTSDVNWGNLDALTSQLKKLQGNGYDAVIAADVSGTQSNAFLIDRDKPAFKSYDITQGITATILLASIGISSTNKGVSTEDIKLCVLKPDTYNHNNINSALDLLEGHAHYLYYSSVGESKRFWFHTKPNINILINQAKKEVKKDEINAEILARLEKQKDKVNRFNVLVNPSEDIPEQTKPTLVLLSPAYQASLTEITGKTASLIQTIASKRGNGDRVYKNTILFMVCSENGYAKLANDVQEYLACIKIRTDYQSQLEQDQKEDLRKKIEHFNQQMDQSLVNAYSLIVKHAAKTGIEHLLVKQFKDSLGIQINTNVYELLKDEEWILESVGVGTLRKNNLVPGPGSPVRVKDVYEAFIRYDDKPMIANKEAVQTSLLRYCTTGEFAIAAGNPGNWTNMYFQQSVNFFDVTDETYWLIDKSEYQADQPEGGNKDGTNGISDDMDTPVADDSADPPYGTTQKAFQQVVISGKVPVENYNQIFSSFIIPLKNNRVEVEIKIVGKSTEANPLTENSQEYKIIKESAKQLGLDLMEE